MESENQVVVAPQVEAPAENTDNASAIQGDDVPAVNEKLALSEDTKKSSWVDPHQKFWMAMDVLRLVSQQGHSFFGTTALSRELIDTAEQIVLNELKGDN